MDEDREVQRLIRDLGNPYYKKWAFEKLVKIGRPALPQLVEALNDKNGNVRENAAELLRKIGDERDILAFIEALKGKGMFSKVRSAAFDALAKIGEPAVPHLIEALNYEDVQYRAVGILGNIAEKRAVDILRHFAEKEVDCSAAIPVLIGFLTNGDTHLRWTTALALGKIGDVRAVPALIATLEDEDLGVRRGAVEALGKIADKCGEVDSVVSALCSVMKDEDEVVRRYAAEGLGGTEDERAVPALIEALKDETRGVPEMAAWALVKIGEPAVPYLVETLNDQDEDVRYMAIEALGKIGNVRAVPYLIDTLKDEHTSVQYRGAEALVKIVEKTAKKGEYTSALKIIKTLTLYVRKKYEGKKDKDSLKRRRELSRLESLTQQIHDKMNKDRKTFPVKRQEVRKTERRPARFLRT